MMAVTVAVKAVMVSPNPGGRVPALTNMTLP
jgi:hypothetical protein